MQKNNGIKEIIRLVIAGLIVGFISDNGRSVLKILMFISIHWMISGIIMVVILGLLIYIISRNKGKQKRKRQEGRRKIPFLLK